MTTPSSKPPALELPTEEDRIFADTSKPLSPFRFDDAVARVFPDMLRRSIPGYATLLHLIGVHAARTLPDNALVYDLGCSLGAVSLSIRHALGTRSAKIHAVDNSPAMVERCLDIVNADSALCPIEVSLGDIESLELDPCSLVVMNFTLQFIEPNKRAGIMQRISNSLLPGGYLILSEKTAPESETAEIFQRETHDAFRQSNGYSQLEMSRKREALERVLTPDSVEQQESLMKDAGLRPMQWFRCLHFVSWAAQKP